MCSAVYFVCDLASDCDMVCCACLFLYVLGMCDDSFNHVPTCRLCAVTLDNNSHCHGG